MKVIEWRQFPGDRLPLGNKFSSMTVGIFDGVHRGHQALIKRIVSHNADYVPVAVTFRQNKKSEKQTPNIQTFQEKAAMLESLGVEILLVIDFTESFKVMPGIEFLKALLEYGNIGFFSVGSNFRCGHQLDTDTAEIQSFFSSRYVPVEIINELTEGSLPISSSRIRSAIAAGNFRFAETMLGRSLG